MIGKGINRFHTVYWPAMLLSAGVSLPTVVFVHGYVISGGQKMSKSIGNVIDPNELLNRYGSDAVRYFLLRHGHPTEDFDLTLERCHEWYTAHLTNGLGNLVARVMQMASQYLDGPVDLSDRRKPIPVQQQIEKFEFNNAMTAIWSDISIIDELIQKEKPFEVFKMEKEKARLRVTYYVKELSRIAELLQPFMPETSEKIHQAIKENKKPENLFPRV